MFSPEECLDVAIDELNNRDIGMPEDGIDRAAELATGNPYANPRPVDYEGVKQLLDDAFRGARPA